jgi:oxaloacetate decarboxylase alpha subunit
MAADLRDKLLANPRAKELAAMKAVTAQEMSLNEARAKFGGAGVSDEDMLLRAIMQGDQEIEAMRGAGPAQQYLGADQPLKTLIAELDKHKTVRFIQVSRGSDVLTLRGAIQA